MSFRIVPSWPQSADAAFFVNGVQGPMIRGWDPDNIELRVRVGADTSPTGASLQLDTMLSGASQVGSIGAIVLD